jgi:hypothetical protein
MAGLFSWLSWHRFEAAQYRPPSRDACFTLAIAEKKAINSSHADSARPRNHAMAMHKFGAHGH